MTRRITRKEMKKDEFVESAVEAGHWIEENWQTVVGWAIGVLAIGAVAFGIYAYSGYSRDQAEMALADGIRLYQAADEQDGGSAEQLETALARFDEAAGRMAAGPAGKTAVFYRGAALYRLGRVDEAIEVLESLSAGDLPPTLSGSADALLARALADGGQTDRALETLERLSLATDTPYPPDLALLQIG